MSAYINRYFLLMAVFLPLWCIIRRPWKRWSLHEGCLMAFAALLFSLLCLVLRGTWAAPGDMLASALHRLRTGEGIQLRLFHTITRQLRYARREEMLINIWGNILLFIPYGFFLPLLWKRYRHPLRLSLMCLLLPISIEMCQLFIQRMTDVDDVLLNFAGGMIGGGVFAGCICCSPNSLIRRLCADKQTKPSPSDNGTGRFYYLGICAANFSCWLT